MNESFRDRKNAFSYTIEINFIQHTVKYTELAAGRFQDFWRDED